MNAKYYPVIRICREFSLIKKRAILPFKLFRSKFIYSESYYPEMPQKSRLIIALELLWHILIYGCIEYHYFSYGLDIKGLRCKKDYLDDNWFLWKCAMINSVQVKHDYTCILRDKDLFAKILDYWKVESPKTICSVRCRNDAISTFRNLFSIKGTYFCKPVDGQCGHGAFKLLVKQVSTAKFEYYINDRIIENNEILNHTLDICGNKSYIIQEYIEQHPAIDEIYNKSINTLRILSVFNHNTNKVEHIAGEVRFGVNGSCVDNLSAGGIAVGIDLETGKLFDFGICKQGGPHRTFVHTDSNIPFKDIEIPFFQESLDLIDYLHSKLSGIRVIGWDIAISSKGPVVIEGNDNPEISGLQTVNGGLAKKVQELIR